jgi:hypothetical protein
MVGPFPVLVTLSSMACISIGSAQFVTTHNGSTKSLEARSNLASALGSTWWAHHTQVHHPFTSPQLSTQPACPVRPLLAPFLWSKKSLSEGKQLCLPITKPHWKHESVHKSGVFYRQNEHNWERKSEMKTSLVPPSSHPPPPSLFPKKKVLQTWRAIYPTQILQSKRPVKKKKVSNPTAPSPKEHIFQSPKKNCFQMDFYKI